MAEKLVINEKLFFPYSRFTFVVFGGGGTGSYLIRDLARIIGINNRVFKREDNMVIIDADVVEEKNLARQNFVRGDIGRNKAEALAGRYSKAFGVDISFIPEYVTKENWRELIDMPKNSQHCNVYLGCVDNNKTRHIIHDIYRATGRAIYIDSGNEEFGGQIVFSTNYGVTEIGNNVNFGGSSRINDAVEEFNLAPDDRHPNDLSCAERAMSAPQNIGTNIMAANILFNYCNAILAGSMNYLHALDRDFRLTDSQYGKDGYERMKNFINNAPMIASHVIFFNSKTNQQTNRPFSTSVQEMIKSYRRY